MGNRGTISSIGKLARLFRRSERGVTAVEFAIVGPVFFAIIGATIETALTFFAGYALDSAVIDSSRYIRTNQTAYFDSPSTYRSAVCGKLYGIFDCDQLRIQVREISNFADFSINLPIDETSGDWRMGVDVALPAVSGSQNYMVEAYYKWPTIFNIPGLNAGQTADGKRLLVATHVFRTEPFGDAP
ncbi:TadE/TadG family type IV pilus assembly protein [Pelagibacterium mangrovi]|uniref:TadE/TadG family type IV pilus assembly protein n=1 Tax=Pelagibacterium mangrovi TaxID=3119828 RepID=UPI002FCC967E